MEPAAKPRVIRLERRHVRFRRWRDARFGICFLTGLIVLAGNGLGTGLHSATAFAQSRMATPSEASAELCTVAPLTTDELMVIAETPGDLLARALGTPVATPLPPEVGLPAAPQVVAAVTTAANEFAACINAGDLPRLMALLTDGIRIRQWGGMLGDPAAIAALATPTPLPPELRVTTVTVTDVRELADGRVSAMVTVNDVPTRIVFAKVGERYLLDASFPLNLTGPVDSGTPAP